MGLWSPTHARARGGGDDEQPGRAELDDLARGQVDVLAEQGVRRDVRLGRGIVEVPFDDPSEAFLTISLAWGCCRVCNSLQRSKMDTRVKFARCLEHFFQCFGVTNIHLKTSFKFF